MADSFCCVLAVLAAAGVEHTTKGRALLCGLMDSMGKVRFPLLTNFLADVMAVMGMLSLSMQRQNAHYATIKSEIDSALQAVADMTVTPGPRLTHASQINHTPQKG